MRAHTSDSTRIYEIPDDKRRHYRIVGSVFIAFGLAAGGFFSADILIHANGRNPLFLPVLIIGLFCIPIFEGVIFIRAAKRVRLVFGPEAIQIVGLVRSLELARSSIVGRRRRAGKGSVITFLVSSPQSHASPARIPDDLAFDDEFKQWLSSVPDLDAIDKENRRAAGKLHWWEH